MRPVRTEHLLHPETLGEERIAHPFRTGLRNSLVAIVAIGIGGLVHLLRFPRLSEFTAWWVWGAVVAGAVAVCFGHAYLGSRVGGRRANGIAVFVLVGVLFALVLWIVRAAAPSQ